MDLLTELSKTPPELSLLEGALNFALCVAASLLLRIVYVRRALSLAGKYHIGNVLPVLAAVTFMVIMVIKSSLALSLGLVGALSIVRFRTPIKEPEELVYLFLAIALGLGYGAGQPLVTTAIFLAIVGLVVTILSRSEARFDSEFNLLLDWETDAAALTDAVTTIEKYAADIEISKFGSTNGQTSAFFKVRFKPGANFDSLGASLRELSPKISFSLFENKPLQ